MRMKSPSMAVEKLKGNIYGNRTTGRSLSFCVPGRRSGYRIGTFGLRKHDRVSRERRANSYLGLILRVYPDTLAP